MTSHTPHIIYPTNPGPGWEKQFIVSDILDNDTHQRNVIHESDFRVSTWKRMSNIDDIIGNNIFVFSSNRCRYKDIIVFVQFIKPIIIIHVSDEWGKKEVFQLLARHTRLLIRQYSHSHYRTYPNIRHMPLGYMSGMMEPNYKDVRLKAPSERKYAWSFVGCPNKQNRPLMLKTMASVTPHVIGKMQCTDMRDLYRNTVFVPNGRGNVVLDCFRIYEASACGAIPIIVGNEDEIKKTFAHEGRIPWLCFRTWPDAVAGCKALLKDKPALDTLGAEVLRWWKTRVLGLQTIVQSTLEEAAREKKGPVSKPNTASSDPTKVSQANRSITMIG